MTTSNIQKKGREFQAIELDDAEFSKVTGGEDMLMASMYYAGISLVVVASPSNYTWSLYYRSK